MIDPWWVMARKVWFNYAQVVWVWENIHALRAGDWPEGCPLSAYTELPGGQQLNCHSKYEFACMIAAEVETRAMRCGQDCYLVEETYLYGLTSREIARKRFIPEYLVNQKIRDVFNYSASGHAQRTESYQEWKRLNKYKHFRRNPATVVQKVLTNDA